MTHSQIVLEQMEKGTPTIQIIKDMYQAFNLSEAKTKQIISNILNERGDCVAYKGESDLLYVDQEQATGQYFECAPELKTNSNYSVNPDWCWIFSDSAHYIFNQVAPPINFTHLWVTRDTNENTNRA